MQTLVAIIIGGIIVWLINKLWEIKYNTNAMFTNSFDSILNSL